MVLARAASASKGLGRTVFRRAGSTTRNRSYRQIGRRGYASDHGHGQQQSSEIPWMIGSAAVTIPAAAWLWQQGPQKSEHGHDSHHGEHEEKADEGKEEEEQPQDESNDTEEPKAESKDEGKDEDKDAGNEESKDDSGSEDKKEEGGNDKANESKEKKSGDDKSEDDKKSKGPGEGQKGERAPTEKKGEKDAQGDQSGAKHPYIDDPEKSKKGAGVTETAKIHGTVDPSAGARGAKESGKSSS